MSVSSAFFVLRVSEEFEEFDEEAIDEPFVSRSLFEFDESDSSGRVTRGEVLGTSDLGLARRHFRCELYEAKHAESLVDRKRFAGSVFDHYGIRAKKIFLLHSPSKGSATNEVVEFVASNTMVSLNGRRYMLAFVRNASMRSIASMVIAAFGSRVQDLLSALPSERLISSEDRTFYVADQAPHGLASGIVIDAHVAAAFASCVVLDAYALRHFWIHDRVTKGRKERQAIVAREIKRIHDEAGWALPVMVVGGAGRTGVMRDFYEELCGAFNTSAEPSIVGSMDHTVLLQRFMPVHNSVKARAQRNDAALEHFFNRAYPSKTHSIDIWQTRFSLETRPQVARSPRTDSEKVDSEKVLRLLKRGLKLLY